MSQYCIRKARIQDVKAMHALLMEEARRGKLLARPFNQLYHSLRDFYVAADADDKVVGCCALSITWEDLAEVRSLVVDPSMRGKRLGGALVSACLDEAREIGLEKVFTLTYAVEFFRHMGFEECEKSILPHKVWADCLNCPSFPDCDETAMIIEL